MVTNAFHQRKFANNFKRQNSQHVLLANESKYGTEANILFSLDKKISSKFKNMCLYVLSTGFIKKRNENKCQYRSLEIHYSNKNSVLKFCLVHLNTGTNCISCYLLMLKSLYIYTVYNIYVQYFILFFLPRNSIWNLEY